MPKNLEAEHCLPWAVQSPGIQQECKHQAQQQDNRLPEVLCQVEVQYLDSTKNGLTPHYKPTFLSFSLVEWATLGHAPSLIFPWDEGQKNQHISRSWLKGADGKSERETPVPTFTKAQEE